MQLFISRALKPAFLEKLKPGKVLVLLGARRTGKTSFLRDLAQAIPETGILQLNGEDLNTQEVLKTRTVENYRKVVGNYRVLMIDEAQKVPEIGLILKLMVDSLPDVRIVATGSSAFDLSGKLGEPLTGRKHTFYMFPLAQLEMAHTENLIETRAHLEERLVYGSYPELIHLPGMKEKSEYLSELVNSYLLKDLLEFDGVKNSHRMLSLLRLIAFQTGSEVSLEELGRQLGISRNTVEKYLDLLTKVFVIHRLPAFSRNLKNEVTKTCKWFFLDNGIRNVLVANLNPLSMRNDTGALWENYLISERLKYQHYSGMIVNNYFWRTYTQQEVDWVEERGGKLHAFEMKWKVFKKIRKPSLWVAGYPESTFQVISPENYLSWITGNDYSTPV